MTAPPAPPGRGALADVLVVATYELQQALRKRLLQVLVLAYAAVMGGANWAFVKLLAQLEGEIALTLGVATTERPGTLIDELLKSESLRTFLGEMVGSVDLLDRLLDTPVLALWSGVVAMVTLPILVLAGTSASVATEVETRSIRYLALRTERLPIVLGKLVGQLAILVLAALAGIVVSEVAALTLMVRVPPGAMFVGALEHTGRALVFSLPFAGLGLAVSQWVPRTNLARLLGLILLIVSAVALPVLGHFSGPDPLGRLYDLLRLFLPGTGWDDVWATDPLAFGLSSLRLAGVCLAWVALGYLRFDRRDL